MEVPVTVQIDSILNTAGGAFRAVLPEEDEKYRYYFIVSQDPANNGKLLMVTTTSQVREHKKKFTAEVLVEVKKGEYDSLDKDSLVNCQYARVKLKGQLRDSLVKASQKGEFEFLPPISVCLLERIHIAIMQCKTIPPIDKALALGSDS